jgi:hypothetical protein
MLSKAGATVAMQDRTRDQTEAAANLPAGPVEDTGQARDEAARRVGAYAAL